MAVSVDQFGKSLVASGLMTAEEVKASWNAIPAEGRPKDGDGFAQLLVDSKKLTPFQAAELLAGRGARLMMGDYTIVAQIGAGGMGQVYKAQHRRMKRTVALKVMSNAAMQDEAAVKRFQREVHAAARLEHPNIVTAYDSGESGSVKYLVMQFVDGGDLSELVKKQGRLGIEQAVGYVIQAAKGLAFAHGEGVIHRDIKPANLLLDKKGIVKILDMGLARFEDGGDGLTATEQVMGTVDYMSPEQAANTKGCDGRADIYSLGCTLWYLLTGKKLYEADTLIARLMLHRDGPLPSLVKERDDAPWPLEQALHKMIAKRMEDRFQSMDEVVAALAPFGSGDGSSSGMGSGIGLSSNSQSAEMASFLKSVGPVASPTIKSAPSKTNVAVDVTAQFAAATADTDPKSQLLPPSKKAAPPQANGSGKKPPPNKNLLLAAAGGGALLVLLGVWFIFRDKDGNEIARVQLSEGGSVTVQQPAATAGKPPVATTTRPTVSFFPPSSTPASPSDMTPPPSVAPPPTVPSSNGVVYLDDLPETERKVGQLKLGKHNLDPFGRPYTWRGKEPAHALMTHPLKDQTAYVSYHIAGLYETFSFVTGIADTSQDGSRNPVLFRVLGDGRELWKSPPLQKVTDEANASISVRDVQELRLEVSCGNNSYHAHAVWLEPRLTPVASPVFPAEALTFGGHRYLLVDAGAGTKLRWNEAKARSEAMGGHLATINTREEFDWLLKSFRNVPSADDMERGTYRLWLGGSTDAQNPNQWKWVTGEPFDRSLWPGSGPDGAKLATAMGLSWYGVQWDDAPPGVVAQYFLVEWDALGPAVASVASRPQPQAPRPSLTIPAEALTFGDHRYLLVDCGPPGTPLLWDQARAQAEAMGGHLAAINSQAEYDWVRNNIWLKRPKTTGHHGRMFLGASVPARSMDWKWVTGEPFDRALWAIGFHGNSSHDLILAWVEDSGGRWSGSDSTTFLGGYYLVEWDTPGAAAPQAGPQAANHALQFDGKTAHVTTPILHVANTPLTIEVTLRPGPVRGAIISNSEGSGLGLDIINGAPNFLAFRRSSGTESYARATAPQPLDMSLPHRLAAVYDGAKIRLFVDGKLAATSDLGGEYLPSDLPLIIGASPEGQGIDYPFTGTLDEVRISKTARYMADYNPTDRLPSDPDTLAMYHFDDGSGDVLKDSSGHSRHGKITGATWVKFEGPGASTSALAPSVADDAATVAKWLLDNKKLARIGGEVGGRVQYVSAVPTGPFKVVELNFSKNNNAGQTLTEEELGRLAVFTDLETLDLGNQPLTDAGLARLTTLKKLRVLTVPNTALTPAAVTTIRQFPQLEKLHSFSTDEWLKPLAGMPSIKSLMVHRSEISLEAMSWFPQYPNLNDLVLQDCFTAVGAELNAALAPLKDCKNLSKLRLSTGSVDAGTVVVLSGLTQLRDLDLGTTQFTEAQVKQLAAALPRCKIIWRDAANKQHIFEPTAPQAAPQAAVPAAPGKLLMHDPAFTQWMKDVQAMSAAKQIEAVGEKLAELHPGFDGKLTDIRGFSPPTIEGGVVTQLKFNGPDVTDISPLRALTGLKALSFGGSSSPKGKLTDLSPLVGMQVTDLTLSGMGYTITDLTLLKELRLEKLTCRDLRTLVDLAPLKGMPLKHLDLLGTAVADVAPLRGMPLEVLVLPKQIKDLAVLQGMPLTRLECTESIVSDLSPLRGMPLETFWCKETNVADLSPLYDCKSLKELNVEKTKVSPAVVAALQKALPNCKVTWDDPAKATPNIGTK
jgi:serine/threonine protein kinase/Leucine-rich repeat (LRR) protein